MEIIPVLDLMNGIVVQAFQGRRETYQPLQSILCASSDPLDVISGLLRFWPFRVLYIADLDALMGTGNQSECIRGLCSAYPELTFWVDAGWPIKHDGWIPVVGSESMTRESLKRLSGREVEWILSLDFHQGRLRGPVSVLEQKDLWPERVIVMCLDQVGSFNGPDLVRLKQIRQFSQDKYLIAAGGVRHHEDVECLERLGFGGVLVATALHTGQLRLAGCHG